MDAGLYSLFDCIIAFCYTILQLTSSFEINLNNNTSIRPVANRQTHRLTLDL